jgi:hypothetical protein
MASSPTGEPAFFLPARGKMIVHDNQCTDLSATVGNSHASSSPVKLLLVIATQDL